MSRRRAATVAALVVGLVVVVGSFAYATTVGRGSRSGQTTLGPSATSGRADIAGSMMGSSTTDDGTAAGMGREWLGGDGIAVTSIESARIRANLAASASRLHPGEVIWFDNGFYVELKDTSGAAATEVIVNPVDGSVTTEPGPAMMWSTWYGMHGRSAAQGAVTVSQDQAKAIAQTWLDAYRPGAAVLSVDSYPGYYTADIGRGGTITGMLSVNATTGQVWFHTWHGTFIAREDA